MKKTYILTIAALLSIAAASCSREQFNGTEENGGQIVTLKVNIPDLAKTCLGEKSGNAYPNYWKENDKICVNGVVSDPLNASYSGKTSAEFTVKGVTAPYYSAYPAEAVSAYSEGTAKIEIPDEQNYVADSYDPKAFVMIGTSTVSDIIDLAPVVSVLHVRLTGEATVKSVVFSARGDNDVFSGTFNTDFETLGTPVEYGNYAEVLSSEGVALPADFFVCVKSCSIEKMSLIAVADDGTRMVKDFNVKKAFEPGKMYNIGEYAYQGEEFIDVCADFITTSTVDITWNTPNTKSYLIGVYSDSACSSLVREYDIPDNDGASNPCWYDKEPKFCISGLEAGTTYYIKVKNVTDEKESDPLEVTTLPFTIVEVSDTPAEVGDVILAEDFGEFQWHADMIGEAAGWTPGTEGKKDFAAQDYKKWQRAKSESEIQLNDVKTAIGKSRLAHWAQGANTTNAVHPGYVKLVASSKITHIVTPSLINIPEGKVATLEVTMTTSPHYSASESKFETEKAVLAVQAGGLNELAESTNTNTLDLTTNAVDVTLSLVQDWTTQVVTIDNVPHGARLAFGPATEVTGNNGRMALSDISVKITDLRDADPSILIASAEEATSSTLCFAWTHPNNTSYNDDSYTFGLYSDPECRNAVETFTTEGGQSLWNKNSKGPKFIFGRLQPGTTYYFKVKDNDAEHGKEAEVVAGTTKEFTPVTVSATPVAEGGTMLAEDFGEIKWDYSQTYKAVGFLPSDLSDFANSGNPAFRKPYDGNEKKFSDMGTPLKGTRLDGWATTSSVYIHAGHLKLGTASAKGWVLTPALVVPEGYVAKVNVSITAAQYDKDQETVWGVGVTSNPGVPADGNPHKSSFNNDSYNLSNYQEVTLSTSFKTSTVEGLMVNNGDRIVFGAKYGGDNTKARGFLSDLKVVAVEFVKEGEEYTISDAETLLAFAGIVNGGKVKSTGTVTADIALTPDEAASLPEINGFAGMLDGDNHTISGLAKPLFNSIADGARIKDITITGAITDSGNNIGLLARICGSANITDVTTEGSVTAENLNLASDACVGGMIGNGDASFSGCTNKAAAKIAGCSGTKAIIIGGVCGCSGSNATYTYCSNEGRIETSCNVGGNLQMGGVTGGDCNQPIDHCTNTGDIYVGGNVGAKLFIGGVAGYLTDAPSATASYLTNGEKDTAKGKISCKDGITITKQAYVGGVTGGEPDKKEITHSHLLNYGEIKFNNVETDAKTGFWYFGGCVGGSGTTYTTYEYCENYGNMTLTGKFKARFGGVIPYTSRNPVGAKCYAQLSFIKKDGVQSANSHVGGVVGYISAQKIDGLIFKGSLTTQSSSPRALVGGIAGIASNDNALFYNCKVATTALNGAGDKVGDVSYYKSVGLICCIESDGKGTSFENCRIEKGSKRGGFTITEDTVLTVNVGDGEPGGLCGHKLSTGTITGCEVVESIDE